MQGQIPLQEIGQDYQLPLAEAVFLLIAVLVFGLFLRAGLFSPDPRRDQ